MSSRDAAARSEAADAKECMDWILNEGHFDGIRKKLVETLRHNVSCQYPRDWLYGPRFHRQSEDIIVRMA